MGGGVVCIQWGSASREGSLHPGLPTRGGGRPLEHVTYDAWWEANPPPPCGRTNACENITLPRTSFAGGKNWICCLTCQMNDVIPVCYGHLTLHFQDDCVRWIFLQNVLQALRYLFILNFQHYSETMTYQRGKEFVDVWTVFRINL